MDNRHLFVKNMVCERCCWLLRTELEHIGLKAEFVKMGEVLLSESPSDEQIRLLANHIGKFGLELFTDHKSILAEAVKRATYYWVNLDHSALSRKTSFSFFLAGELGYDYHYLSTLFTRQTGSTIEKFLILNRIEKTKELLSYGESLTNIADKLGYSSVQALSSQYRKLTGIMPSRFKPTGRTERFNYVRQ